MAHKKVWQEISIFDMVRFVHQKVAVHVHDNREFVGWVYTVDPVTQRWVHAFSYLAISFFKFCILY